jgi:hypothetical protein
LVTSQTQDASEEGSSKATAESQANAGLCRVYNQSCNFSHNGDSILITKWCTHLNLKILTSNLIHCNNILILIKILCQVCTQ